MNATLRCCPKKRNILLGVIEAGGASGLVAMGLGVALADAGMSNGMVALAVAMPLLVGAGIVGRRYVPMCASLDATNDEIRYRNTWRSGAFRWSEVETFAPLQVFVGYDITRAVLRDGRTIKLRAAPFEEFVAKLRAVAAETGN